MAASHSCRIVSVFEGKPATISTLRSANPGKVAFQVVILEPPLAGQLETTVEQSGDWRETDAYLIERQTAYGHAIARILGHGSRLGPTIADEAGLERVALRCVAGDGLFLLPHATVCDPTIVSRFRLSRQNFYGGIVARAHERTKVLMHDVIHAEARRPSGWNSGFALAIRRLTIPGHSVFGVDDLKAATRDIVSRFGAARIKLATGANGLGQFVINRMACLDTVVQQIEASDALKDGACVEVELRKPVTYSISSERIGELQMSSVGIHRRETMNPVAQTEIGTDYHVVVGGVDDIRIDLTGLDCGHIRRSISLAREFDKQVSIHLRETLITRRTYQVITGVDERGKQHMGILEQSWRRGGSSANTLLAAQEFLTTPRLKQVSCSQDNAFDGLVEPGHWILSTCRERPYVARVTGRHYE